jgi:hypothetical protein
LGKGGNDIKAEYIPQLAENLCVSIIQKHNEGKDNSIFNGAVIVLTDKESVLKLVDLFNEHVKRQKH